MVNPTLKQTHAIRRGVNGFQAHMILKLHENADKGLWDECDYIYLRGRIEEELIELDAAISKKDYIGAREELADVANFCMMIHDNLVYGRFKEFRK